MKYKKEITVKFDSKDIEQALYDKLLTNEKFMSEFSKFPEKKDVEIHINVTNIDELFISNGNEVFYAEVTVKEKQ